MGTHHRRRRRRPARRSLRERRHPAPMDQGPGLRHRGHDPRLCLKRASSGERPKDLSGPVATGEPGGSQPLPGACGHHVSGTESKRRGTGRSRTATLRARGHYHGSGNALLTVDPTGSTTQTRSLLKPSPRRRRALERACVAGTLRTRAATASDLVRALQRPGRPHRFGMSDRRVGPHSGDPHYAQLRLG